MRTSTPNHLLRLQEQHASAFGRYGRDARDLVAMAELFDDRTRRVYEQAERQSRMMHSGVVESAFRSMHSGRRMLDRALTPATARQLLAAQSALEPARRVEEMLRQAVAIAAEQALYERSMRPWSAAGHRSVLDVAPPVSTEDPAASGKPVPRSAGADRAVEADAEPRFGEDSAKVGRLADFYARVDGLSQSERRALGLNLAGIALAVAQVVVLWGKAGGVPAALTAGSLLKAILELVNSISALYEDDEDDTE